MVVIYLLIIGSVCAIVTGLVILAARDARKVTITPGMAPAHEHGRLLYGGWCHELPMLTLPLDEI